jgi:AcrR family transcriptional regulator
MARPQKVSDEQILDAARACFLEHGASVSTSVIAQRLGISQPALFKRFGTKERLMIAALKPTPDAVLALLDAGPDDRPMRVQLRAIAGALDAFAHEMVPRVFVLRSAGIHPGKLCEAGEQPPTLRVQQAMASWIRRGQDLGRLSAGNVDAISMAFLGAIQGRAFVQHHAGSPAILGDTESYLDSFVNVLWDGVNPGGEAP